MDNPLIIALIFLAIAAISLASIAIISSLLVRLAISFFSFEPVSDAHYQQVKTLMLSLP